MKNQHIKTPAIGMVPKVFEVDRNAWADQEPLSLRGGQGVQTPSPPGKSQVGLAIGFLRNTGTDPHFEALLGPFIASQVYTALCEIQ